MPELPDVEVFRSYFDRTSLNQNVRQVDVYDRRILSEVTQEELRGAMSGRRFESTRRHGKFLFAATDIDLWLVLHFGMTGYLSYLDDGAELPDHTRVLFLFDESKGLAYVCQRMLGQVTFTSNPDQFIQEKNLGLDAFATELNDFRDALSGRRGTIKSALTNQSVLAGIGNIYADEILFQSKIHPKTQTGDLSDSDLETLYEQTQRVLLAGIDSKVDIDRMPDWFLLPRRQEDEACPRCGTGIQTLKVSSRTAYYCPNCQPEPRAG